MQEYLQIIKKKILIDKLKSSLVPFQESKSSQTLVQDLILKEKGLKPFWKESTKVLSEKLWLPIKTDCVDLELNSLNGSLKNLIQNSQSSIKVQKPHQNIPLENYQMTSYPSLMSSLQGIMESDQESLKEKERKKNLKNLKIKKKLRPEKSYKIRLYPNQEQKQDLKKWFGASRYVYNSCLYHINSEKDFKEQYKMINKKYLRSKFINNINYKNNNTWMLDVHYDIRDEAMNDLLKNYTSNFAKSKNSGKKFTILYKSKKNRKDSIAVLSKYWNNSSGMLSKTLTSMMKGHQKLPKVLNYDCRLIKNENNQYYLCIPEPLEHFECENQTPKIISLDPGVRTFMTGYDLSGQVLELKKNSSKIGVLLHHKKKLQSKIAIKKIKVQGLKRALRRVSLKLYNTVDESHKMFAKYLCSNYNYIVVPKMSFHSFNNLNKKSKNMMKSLRHCSFVDRLINKSREYGSKVIVAEEDYTSKTCTCCGNLKNDLGSSKIYNCNVCNTIIDRDINGARNILLKFITEHL